MFRHVFGIEKNIFQYFRYCDTVVYLAGMQFIRQEIELGAVRINELLKSYFRLFDYFRIVEFQLNSEC